MARSLVAALRKIIRITSLIKFAYYFSGSQCLKYCVVVSQLSIFRQNEPYFVVRNWPNLVQNLSHVRKKPPF